MGKEEGKCDFSVERCNSQGKRSGDVGWGKRKSMRARVEVRIGNRTSRLRQHRALVRHAGIDCLPQKCLQTAPVCFLSVGPHFLHILANVLPVWG